MSLTNTEICKLQIAIDDVFSNPNLLGASTPTIQAVADRQTVRFTNFNAAVLNGCTYAEVVWLESCDNVVDDCANLTNCDIGGNAPTSQKYALEHNLCKTIEFTIDLSDCNNFYTPERLRAEMFAKHINKIEQSINKAIISQLATKRETVVSASFPSTTPSGGTVVIGDNPGGTAGSPGTYVDISTELKSADMGWLLAGLDSECMNDPYLLSGGMMKADYYQALAENPACCNPELSTFTSGALDIVFDDRNIDQTLANGVKNVLAIDPNATAFWSANNFTNDTPVAWNDKLNTWVWRIRSPRLTFRSGGATLPVYYDVFRQVTCNVGAGPNKHYPVEAYRIVFNGGFHVMPDTMCAGECPGTTTGVIHFGSTNPPL